MNVCHRQRPGVVCRERGVSGKHFVADHTERVEITRRGGFESGRLFR